MSFWSSFTSLFNLRATREKNGEFFYVMGGGRGSAYSLETPLHYLKAFEECPVLAAAIIRKAQYAANGKAWVLNLKDDDESETAFGKEMRRLLKKPNILQNWKQFKTNYTIFKNLFGYCVILVVNPSGFTKINSQTAMWILPPWCLDIKLTGTYYSATELRDVIKSIDFTYGGSKKPIDIASVIIIKDASIGITNNILPDSRIKSLGYPIATVVDGLRSNNVIIKKRGGIGILSNGGKDSIGQVPLLPADKKEVQDKLQKQYGLGEDQSEIIITSASLNWQSMSFDAAQLKIHESVDMAGGMICDIVGFNKMLLSSSDHPTFNNVNEIKKDVYQGLIPECESDFETFEQFFQCEANGCRLMDDFDHIEVLQENKKDAATARQTLTNALRTEFYSNVITLNQWLESIEMETVPQGDKYYYELLKEGWVFDNKIQPAAQSTTEPTVN